MQKRGQGSLEYLLLIGGGVLVAVIIVSTVLTIPNNSGQSNEYGVANAQCASYLQNGNLRCDNQTVKSGTNTYNCRWDTTTNRCGSQPTGSSSGPTTQFNSPINLQHFLVPSGGTVTVATQIGYTGFSPNQPNNTTIQCKAGGTPTPLNCSGGTCNADCQYYDSTDHGQQIIQPVTLTATGGQTANATNNPSIIIDYCGDLTCQATENCTGDAASCQEPAVCYQRTCTDGCNTANQPTALPIANGQTDTEGANQCHDATGCPNSPCVCNAGSCVQGLSACGPPAGGWVDGRTYTLTTNVSTPASSAASCFDITGSGPNGIILDCQHNTISANADASIANPLVKITRDKVTLTNCNINLNDTTVTTQALRIQGPNATIQQTSLPQVAITSNANTYAVYLGAADAKILGDMQIKHTNNQNAIVLDAGGIIIDGAEAIVEGPSVTRAAINIGLNSAASNAQIKNSPLLQGAYGVFVGTLSSTGIHIFGNTISANNGVYVSSSATDRDMTIAGNNITTTGSSGQRGIYANAPDINISNNTISASGGAPKGIYYGTATAPIGNGTIYGNTITMAPTGSSAAQGIFLQNVTNMTIGGAPIGNSIAVNCSGATGYCYGIYITGAAAPNISSNNTISNNTIQVNSTNPYSQGIYLDGGFNSGSPLNYVQTTAVTGNIVCAGSVKTIDVNSSDAQSPSSGNSCGAAKCYQYASGTVCSSTGWANCTTSC